MPENLRSPQSRPLGAPGYYLADWARDLSIFVLVLARPVAARPAQTAPASRAAS